MHGGRGRCGRAPPLAARDLDAARTQQAPRQPVERRGELRARLAEQAHVVPALGHPRAEPLGRLGVHAAAGHRVPLQAADRRPALVLPLAERRDEAHGVREHARVKLGVARAPCRLGLGDGTGRSGGGRVDSGIGRSAAPVAGVATIAPRGHAAVIPAPI
jgi:hypothetical protein